MTKEDIQKFLDDYINPALEAHSGFLKLVRYDVQEKDLYVELGGGCQGCAMSKETLQGQIGRFLIEEFPELNNILDITDHSAGKNPYYRYDDET